MKCISDKIVQEYIDDELSSNDRIKLEKHLKTCEKCNSKVKHQRILANNIKATLNVLGKTNISRIEKEKSKLEIKSTFRKRLLISASAAASILLFVFVINNQVSKEAEPYVLVQTVESEVDANKSILQQNFVIKVIDNEGNVTECFIDNNH
jgi:anti-sigma factor RsiW